MGYLQTNEFGYPLITDTIRDTEKLTLPTGWKEPARIGRMRGHVKHS